MDYAIWRCCERFGIRPPHIAETWEETNFWGQAQLLAFDMIRQIEDSEERMAPALAMRG